MSNKMSQHPESGLEYDMTYIPPQHWDGLSVYATTCSNGTSGEYGILHYVNLVVSAVGGADVTMSLGCNTVTPENLRKLADLMERAAWGILDKQ